MAAVDESSLRELSEIEARYQIRLDRYVTAMRTADPT